MRILIIIIFLITISLGIYYTFLYNAGNDIQPELDEGNYLEIQNIKYTKTNMIEIKYDVFNNSTDTLYVVLSDWEMVGVMSRLRNYVIDNIFRLYNVVLYSPIYPKYAKPKYATDTAVNYIFNQYVRKYLKLPPMEKQQIKIEINKKIATKFIKSLNDYKFRIRMLYYNSDDWKKIQTVEDVDMRKYIINKQIEPIIIDIKKENSISTSLLNKSEIVTSVNCLPLRLSKIGEFVLK